MDATDSKSASRPPTAHAEAATFLRPADLLRPRTAPAPPRSERPIDRDERIGLVSGLTSSKQAGEQMLISGQKRIRDFLRLRNCYEVLPLSFRLIELDVSLTVKDSLNILVQCGIVSAPLWDSATSTYAGLLTVNDYLNVIRYYNLHADKLKDVDNLLLSDLREVERVLNVKPPETIAASPETILYDALRKQLTSRARRIPLISYDSDTQRIMITSVITQYRILKFIAMNIKDTDLLRKPLSQLRLGTYENIFRCEMDSTVLDVIDGMVERNISSVPVINEDGTLYNVFEAVDVIETLKSGDYGNLTWSVGRALDQRSPDHPGIYTCTLDDGLDTIFDTIRKSRVHRLMVVDENNVLKGTLSLSDILHYILVGGEEAAEAPQHAHS
ncbi:hypothetical protein DV735_g5267, partial [Chaetothyriales sp. CBS 134920]